MAVVSISKIQVRRGRKNSDEGLPQLASGEFGWAIDTQELYIGNGSVAEGAPFVGNTRLLSSQDNLFELATNYSYLQGLIQTGRSTTTPVTRSLQDRLDDRVSLRAFGSAQEEVDHASVLQLALDQLYLSDKESSDRRFVLHIEPGTYTLTKTVYVPPFACIAGSGIDRTVFEVTGDFPAFETVSSKSIPIRNKNPGVYINDGTVSYETQARHIRMSGFTIKNDYSHGICVHNCRHSVFEDIAIKKTPGHTPDTSEWGIYFQSLGTSVASRNNLFNRVSIKDYGHSVKTDYNIYDNTWLNCSFTDAVVAVLLGAENPSSAAQEAGSVASLFHQCMFDRIEKQGILVVRGAYNTSSSNKYYNVGNNLGIPDGNDHANFESSSSTDVSTGDWFERQKLLSNDENFSLVSYVSEVSAPSFVDFDETHTVDIGFAESSAVLCRLPAGISQSFEIEYLYNSNEADTVRSGTMSVASNANESDPSFADEYTVSGDNETALDLFAEFTADGKTIEIKYTNATPGDTGKIHYRIKARSLNAN